MSYLTSRQLRKLGFRSVGREVKVSSKASIYDSHLISLGDYSRIDDFCVLSGWVEIGRNVHITIFGNISGGRAGVSIGDFSTLAYGCHIVAQTDDYSGQTMTNSTVPTRYKGEISSRVRIGRHVILGTGTVVMPGVELGDGVAGGARTLFLNSADPWTIYVGQPARKLRDRSRNLLGLEREFLQTESC